MSTGHKQTYWLVGQGKDGDWATCSLGGGGIEGSIGFV